MLSDFYNNPDLFLYDYIRALARANPRERIEVQRRIDGKRGVWLYRRIRLKPNRDLLRVELKAKMKGYLYYININKKNYTFN